MTGRVALYYAPEPGSELDRFGASWLGRDAVTGRSIDAPVLPGITGSMRRDITATARKYGFHATLKPPFALATSRVGFDEAVAEFARNMAPFEAPPLTVGVLDGFVALLPSAPSPELRALADGCVTSFRKHAARPGDAELARRRDAGLTLRQEQNLRWWGYPYVLEDYRFHMTLTNRLPDPGHVCRSLAALFEPLAACPLAVNAICVFEQTDRDAPFLMTARYPLSGAAESHGFKHA